MDHEKEKGWGSDRRSSGSNGSSHSDGPVTSGFLESIPRNRTNFTTPEPPTASQAQTSSGPAAIPVPGATATSACLLLLLRPPK
ncbi:hypothetical protein PG987_015022 [Apiospora arundinis]